jgi:hypothetical protein
VDLPIARISADARFVAEQLAGDPARCQGGAVDRYQEVLTPRTQLVNRSSDQFLTGAGFTKDQHGTVRSGDLLDR